MKIIIIFNRSVFRQWNLVCVFCCSRANSSLERGCHQLLPGSFTSASFLIVGISLFGNASPKLVPILSVQSLIPWIVISNSGLQFTTLLGGALSSTPGLCPARSNRVAILWTGVGNAVLWNGLLTESGRLSNCHGLVCI